MFLVTALVLAAFCSAQADPGSGRGSYRQEGIASWYGNEFAGLPTASGEAFNPAALTAAHPTLPFGTQLRITNRHNNRQVIVKVNDRGPFVPTRIVDVSRAAAEQLDMIQTGTAPVIVEMADQVVYGGSTAGQTPPLPPVQQVLPTRQTQPPVRTGTVNLGEYAQPDGASQAQQPIYQALPPPAIAQTGMVMYDSLPPTAEQIQHQSAPVYQPLSDAPLPVTQSAPAPDLLWSLDEEAPPPAPPPAKAQTSAASPAASPPAAAAKAARPAAAIKPGIPAGGQNRVYRLQIGSYKEPKNATGTFERLKQAGLNPAYERNGDYYRVVLSGVKAEEVSGIAEKLGAAGFTEAIIREEKK